MALVIPKGVPDERIALDGFTALGRCISMRMGGHMTRPQPWLVAALGRLRHLSLTSSQNLTLRAMLDFGGPQHLEVWPSVKTLAARTNLAERTVRNALRALEKSEVIRRVHESRGGIDKNGHGLSNRWRLTFVEALENPATIAGLDAPEPGNPRPSTRQIPPENPATIAGKPSIHNSPKNSPSFRKPFRSLPSEMVGWDEAPDARTMLVQLGVRGEYLDLLADAPGVTPEQIGREWNAIADDRGVRNKSAVLVRRLAQLSGVEIHKRTPLPADTLSAIGRIEANRRRQMQAGE